MNSTQISVPAIKAENASMPIAESQPGIRGGIRLSVAIGDYFNGSLALEAGIPPLFPLQAVRRNFLPLHGRRGCTPGLLEPFLLSAAVFASDSDRTAVGLEGLLSEARERCAVTGRRGQTVSPNH